MSRFAVVVLGAILVLGSLAWWFSQPGERPAPAPAADGLSAGGPAQPDARTAEVPRVGAPTDGVRIDVDPVSGSLVRLDLRHAADTRTPEQVDRVAEGILCPDGSCLPLLNGVESAPGIMRDEMHGPVPPVVALIVDADGWEWYEHADGSTTTCRPHFIIRQDGTREVQVVTVHDVPQGDDGPVQEVPPVERTGR